jgi:hypothetical protein
MAVLIGLLNLTLTAATAVLRIRWPARRLPSQPAGAPRAGSRGPGKHDA